MWKWPPPELAAPQRLPLADAPAFSDSPTRRQMRRDSSIATSTEVLSPTLAQAASLPGSWYQPVVVAAALAALQNTALAAPLDDSADPATYLQSLMSGPLPVRSKTGRALSDDARRSCTTLLQAEALLELRLSALSELQMANVVQLQPDRHRYSRSSQFAGGLMLGRICFKASIVVSCGELLHNATRPSAWLLRKQKHLHRDDPDRQLISRYQLPYIGAGVLGSNALVGTKRKSCPSLLPTSTYVVSHPPSTAVCTPSASVPSAALQDAAKKLP